jgi:hypothetical protein
VQRVWLQVALAAGAGLGSLAVCSGALVAIVSLVISEGHLAWISSSLATTFFWFGLVNAILFAGASLSLAALALGARGGARSDDHRALDPSFWCVRIFLLDLG